MPKKNAILSAASNVLSASAKIEKPAKNAAEKAEAYAAKISKLFHLQDGANYPGNSAAIRRSFTIAALIVSGYVKLEKGKSPRLTVKGDYQMFSELTNGKAARVWNNKLLSSPAGKKKISSALQGNEKGGYNSALSIVGQFVGGFTKGGNVTVTDHARTVKETVKFVSCR